MTLAELLRRPMPPKLKTPAWNTPAITGWCCNVHALRSYSPSDCIWQAWRDSQCQYRDAEMKHGSRTLTPMYATRQDALVALAHELWDETRGHFDAICKMFDQ